MEGLIKQTDGTKRFVRIGKGSCSDTLQPYNLKALENQIFKDAKVGAYTDSTYLYYYYKKKYREENEQMPHTHPRPERQLQLHNPIFPKTWPTLRPSTRTLSACSKPLLPRQMRQSDAVQMSFLSRLREQPRLVNFLNTHFTQHLQWIYNLPFSPKGCQQLIFSGKQIQLFKLNTKM